MQKRYLPIVLLLLGIACWITYGFIGSYVAKDGTLVEPFALIPIGYLLITIAIILFIITLIKKTLHK